MRRLRRMTLGAAACSMVLRLRWKILGVRACPIVSRLRSKTLDAIARRSRWKIHGATTRTSPGDRYTTLVIGIRISVRLAASRSHRRKLFSQRFPKPSLGLAVSLRTTRRAISTRIQQSRHWILVDTRLYIGQGNCRKREPSMVAGS